MPVKRLRLWSKSSRIGSNPRAIDVSVTDDFSQQLSAFLKRLHQEETSELIEKKPNSGLIEAGVVEPEIIEEAG